MARTWRQQQQQQQVPSKKWRCCFALLVHLITMCFPHHIASAKVVQLVSENPSPFVSSDPNDPQYIVSLFDDADKAHAVLPEVASLRSMVMTDAAGRRFNCSIPTSPPSAGTALSPQQDPPSQAAQVVKSPFELLEALTALCLYHKDNLWTYELCHRKHVRQFRKQFSASISTTTMEGGSVAVVVDATAPDFQQLVDAAKAGDVSKLLSHVFNRDDTNGREQEDFSCGQYNGDDQQIEAILEDASSSGHPIKYVSHTFSGGAKCVLTGQPRSAEVRYTCARQAQENMILSVREFPTCNYVVVVSTPFLCRHPAFTPQAEDIRLVSCVPLDWSVSTSVKPERASNNGQKGHVGHLETAGKGTGSSSGQEKHLAKAAAQSKAPSLQGAADGTVMPTKQPPARQQPPEIGIELKSKRRGDSSSIAVSSEQELRQHQQQVDVIIEDLQQQEEDVNDVEGFVVLSYDDEAEESDSRSAGDVAGSSVHGASSSSSSSSTRDSKFAKSDEVVSTSGSNTAGASDGDDSRHARRAMQHEDL